MFESEEEVDYDIVNDLPSDHGEFAIDSNAESSGVGSEDEQSNSRLSAMGTSNDEVDQLPRAPSPVNRDFQLRDEEGRMIGIRAKAVPYISSAAQRQLQAHQQEHYRSRSPSENDNMDTDDGNNSDAGSERSDHSRSDIERHKRIRKRKRRHSEIETGHGAPAASSPSDASHENSSDPDDHLRHRRRSSRDHYLGAPRSPRYFHPPSPSITNRAPAAAHHDPYHGRDIDTGRLHSYRQEIHQGEDSSSSRSEYMSRGPMGGQAPEGFRIDDSTDDGSDSPSLHLDSDHEGNAQEARGSSNEEGSRRGLYQARTPLAESRQQSAEQQYSDQAEDDRRRLFSDDTEEGYRSRRGSEVPDHERGDSLDSRGQLDEYGQSNSHNPNHNNDDSPSDSGEDGFANMDMDDFERFMEQFVRDKSYGDDDPASTKDRIMRARDEICLQDLSTFTWTDLLFRHRISEAAERELREFHDIISDPDAPTLTPSEIRTAVSRLMDLTGVRANVHGRCRKNCSAFRDDDVETMECIVCGEDRYKIVDGERVNAANYWTIPIIPRLIAWYMDYSKAETMSSYPREAAKSYGQKILADFWSGLLYQKHLKKDRGLFTEATDLAFYFSCDEYRAMSKKSTSKFGAWPLILLCYNLPTEIRYKDSNTLTYGLIPGPKMPERVDTFLYPLIAEFKRLADGVDAYNAYRQYERFILRAYIVIIGADMMARHQLLRFLGKSAKAYCEYCYITGLWKQGIGIRCVHRQPVDAPLEVIQREQRFQREGKPFFDFGVNGDAQRRKPKLRTDREIRDQARQVEEARDVDNEVLEEMLSRLFGIQGLSAFAELNSIVFPFAFPPDFMHAVLLGLLRWIYKILTGKKIAPGEDELLFFNDDIWRAIGVEQLASKPHYPSAFGEVFDISKVGTSMKAANWYTWAIQQALIYLRTALRTPEEYEIIQKVVFAVELSGRRSLTWEEVDIIEILFEQFLEYIETNVYRRQYDRMILVTPNLHQVAKHMAHGIRMCGPTPGYWQFKMEEVIGKLREARSKRYPNESLFKYIFIQELVKMVPYILPPMKDDHYRGGVAGTGLDTAYEDVEGFCDRTGRLRLGRLLGFYRHRMIAHYRACDMVVPWELDRRVTGRKKLRNENKKFQHTSLVDIFSRLPTRPVNGVPWPWRAGDGVGLPQPPPGFDYLYFDPRAVAADFMADRDHHYYLATGEARPFFRAPRPPIIHGPPPEGVHRSFEAGKEIRVYQPVGERERGFEFTDIEKRRILDYVEDNELIPLDRLFDERGNRLLFDALNLSPRKWKAMTISYPSSRQSYAGVNGFIQKVNVNAYGSGVAGEGIEVRSDRERASSYVQYLGPDESANADPTEVPTRSAESLIGVVRYFVSIELPGEPVRRRHDHDQRRRPYTRESEEPGSYPNRAGGHGARARGRDDRQPHEESGDDSGHDEDEVDIDYALLAYVDRFPIETTTDGLLLRLSDREARQIEDADDGISRSFIPAINIYSLVGFLRCNGRDYLTWKDGCWTTDGREDLILRAIEQRGNAPVQHLQAQQ